MISVCPDLCLFFGLLGSELLLGLPLLDYGGVCCVLSMCGSWGFVVRVGGFGFGKIKLKRLKESKLGF